MPLVIRIYKGGLPPEQGGRKPQAGRRAAPRRLRAPKGPILGRIWRARFWLTGVAAVLAVFVAWLVMPYWRLTAQFGSEPTQQPSRLWGRAAVLEQDAPGSTEGLVAELARVGYREVKRGDAERNGERVALVPGEYRLDGEAVELHSRRYPTPEGMAEPFLLRADLAGGRVRSLEWNGQAVERVILEPPLLASFYGDSQTERRPLRLEQLPPYVTRAVIASEDRTFYRHQGLSIVGMLRALWFDIRNAELRQGGSTLTQQLVKNLYLTHERTASRKAREAVLAFFLELRYEKDEILQAYLNESYFGRKGRVNFVGLGAAAWGMFGKTPEALTLNEAATLVGVIPAPNAYSPLRHKEKALTRRNLVLRRMAEEGFLSSEELAAAIEEPLEVSPPAASGVDARYAADAAAAEARQRYGVETLANRGYHLLSTLSQEDQVAAEESVRWGIEALENGWEKNHGTEHRLQSALVSVDPRDGSVLSWVGGRSYSQSQFDRARQARRQAGSAFKPMVYAAAFAQRTVSPSTRVEDSPLEVVQAGQTWRPRNYDGEFHGMVTVREAVERSYNVPTAEVALRVGLDKVVAWAEKLGIESELRSLPSIALGSLEVTPVELLTAYSTLANQGRRTELHLLAGVLDREGKPVRGRELAAPRQVIGADVAFLMTSVLEGVVDHGTASRARVDGLADPMAGKTGTTNQGRDSWFVGYGPTRATVVWVGYDEGDATALTGSRAALPIWSRFTQARRPRGGYPDFSWADGVVSVTIDPESGQLATTRCFNRRSEVFLEDQAPDGFCELHGGEKRRGRGWWRRVLRGRSSGEERERWRSRGRRP